MLTRQQQRKLNYAACHAVLDTPELLEAILLNLDMRTLLACAQRVNHRWHTTIAGSKSLQCLLYFQPMSQQDESNGRVPNPVLAEAFPIWFATAPENRRNYYRKDFANLPMCKNGTKKAFMRQNASWRRMLVSQPPVEKLGCWMIDHPTSGEIPHDDWWKLKILSFPLGLRMGKFYDLAQRWTGATTRANFSVYWTPTDTEILQGFYFFRIYSNQMRLELTEALRRSGMVVDLILRGMRWDAPGTDSVQADKVFRQRFAYRHCTDQNLLEPESDGEYKTAAQWLHDEDAAQNL